MQIFLTHYSWTLNTTNNNIEHNISMQVDPYSFHTIAFDTIIVPFIIPLLYNVSEEYQ